MYGKGERKNQKQKVLKKLKEQKKVMRTRGWKELILSEQVSKYFEFITLIDYKPQLFNLI